MLVTTHHPAKSWRSAYVEVTIILSSGEVAGGGRGPIYESAEYWAIADARQSSNPRHQTAGQFYKARREERAERLGKPWYQLS